MPPYTRVKQEDDYVASPLDDYTFVKAWILQVQPHGQRCFGIWQRGDLLEVGPLNAREGVREEKWTSFDLRTVKFPSTQTSSARRATLFQNFEADFIRAMGIISPSAALSARR